MNSNLMHELVFGALIANIGLVLTAIKYMLSMYKHAIKFIERHNMMYLDYCERHHINPREGY